MDAQSGTIKHTHINILNKFTLIGLCYRVYLVCFLFSFSAMGACSVWTVACLLQAALLALGHDGEQMCN